MVEVAGLPDVLSGNVVAVAPETGPVPGGVDILAAMVVAVTMPMTWEVDVLVTVSVLESVFVTVVESVLVTVVESVLVAMPLAEVNAAISKREVEVFLSTCFGAARKGEGQGSESDKKSRESGFEIFHDRSSVSFQAVGFHQPVVVLKR